MIRTTRRARSLFWHFPRVCGGDPRALQDVYKRQHVTRKVIFENCYLDDEEKRTLCKIALDVQPDYIKTSTGFGKGGATFEDIALMKEMVGERIKIKAAGGIRTLQDAKKMIELGASRIGSTASVQIVEAFLTLKK